jgi:hypothetical protein
LAQKLHLQIEEWARPGSETMGVACKALKVARNTNAADVQTVTNIFAASGAFWGYRKRYDTMSLLMRGDGMCAK